MKPNFLKPRYIRQAWAHIIKFFDKQLKDCKIVYDENTWGYSRKEHKIKLKFHSHHNRIDLIRGLIKMFIMNIVPAARQVVYDYKDCILISEENIMEMAGKMAFTIYPRIKTDDWKHYINAELRESRKKYMVPIKKVALSRDDLFYLYYEKNLSQAQIGEMVGHGQSVIYELMKYYDMPINRKKVISADIIYKLYYEKDYTLREMSRILNTSCALLVRRMDEYGFKRRDKAFFMPSSTMCRDFESVLRKKFRRNKRYIDCAEKMVNWAKENPDLPVYKYDD